MCRRRIAEAGAIPLLAQLLTSGSRGTRQAAARALSNLVVNSEANKVEVVKFGAVHSLVSAGLVSFMLWPSWGRHKVEVRGVAVVLWGGLAPPCMLGAQVRTLHCCWGHGKLCGQLAIS